MGEDTEIEPLESVEHVSENGRINLRLYVLPKDDLYIVVTDVEFPENNVEVEMQYSSGRESGRMKRVYDYCKDVEKRGDAEFLFGLGRRYLKD